MLFIYPTINSVASGVRSGLLGGQRIGLCRTIHRPPICSMKSSVTNAPSAGVRYIDRTYDEILKITQRTRGHSLFMSSMVGTLAAL